MSLDCVQVNAEAKKGGWNVLADADAADYTYTLVFIYVVHHTIFHGPYHAVNSGKKCVEFHLKSR